MYGWGRFAAAQSMIHWLSMILGPSSEYDSAWAWSVTFCSLNHFHPDCCTLGTLAVAFSIAKSLCLNGPLSRHWRPTPARMCNSSQQWLDSLICLISLIASPLDITQHRLRIVFRMFNCFVITFVIKVRKIYIALKEWFIVNDKT